MIDPPLAVAMLISEVQKQQDAARWRYLMQHMHWTIIAGHPQQEIFSSAYLLDECEEQKRLEVFIDKMISEETISHGRSGSQP